MRPLVLPLPGVRLKALQGGVCAVDGVTAAGVAAGLKRSRALDVAIVDAGRPVPAAAVFTTNQVKAAPVLLSRRHLSNGHARAVLLNAGQRERLHRTGGDGDGRGVRPGRRGRAGLRAR